MLNIAAKEQALQNLKDQWEKGYHAIRMQFLQDPRDFLHNYEHQVGIYLPRCIDLKIKERRQLIKITLANKEISLAIQPFSTYLWGVNNFRLQKNSENYNQVNIYGSIAQIFKWAIEIFQNNTTTYNQKDSKPALDIMALCLIESARNEQVANIIRNNWNEHNGAGILNKALQEKVQEYSVIASGQDDLMGVVDEKSALGYRIIQGHKNKTGIIYQYNSEDLTLKIPMFSNKLQKSIQDKIINNCCFNWNKNMIDQQHRYTSSKSQDDNTTPTQLLENESTSLILKKINQK